MKYAVALTLSVLLGAGSARAVAQSGITLGMSMTRWGGRNDAVWFTITSSRRTAPARSRTS